MTSGSADIAANASASWSRHSRNRRRGVRSATGTLFLSRAAPAHLIKEHLLQLLEPFEPGGEPGFQHRLRVERLQVGAHPLLDLLQQLLLHRLDVGHAEKAAQLVGRAIDVEADLHGAHPKSRSASFPRKRESR